jgi:hypothetical protein
MRFEVTEIHRQWVQQSGTADFRNGQPLESQPQIACKKFRSPRKIVENHGTRVIIKTCPPTRIPLHKQRSQMSEHVRCWDKCHRMIGITASRNHHPSKRGNFSLPARSVANRKMNFLAERERPPFSWHRRSGLQSSSAAVLPVLSPVRCDSHAVLTSRPSARGPRSRNVCESEHCIGSGFDEAADAIRRMSRNRRLRIPPSGVSHFLGRLFVVPSHCERDSEDSQPSTSWAPSSDPRGFKSSVNSAKPHDSRLSLRFAPRLATATDATGFPASSQ